MFKLDDRDIEILKVLSAEARMSKAELAKRINLSPSPCWERLKRLEAAGLINGYHAEISLKKIVPNVTVFVTVELERHKADTFQKFERAIHERAEITGCWALGGGFDYLLKIVIRDIDAYQRLIDTLLEQGLGFSRYYTYIVTKPVKTGAPLPFDALFASADENKGTARD